MKTRIYLFLAILCSFLLITPSFSQALKINNNSKVGIGGDAHNGYQLRVHGNLRVNSYISVPDLIVYGDINRINRIYADQGSLDLNQSNTLQINGGSESQYALYVNGGAWKTGGGSWSGSDEKLKKDIENIEDIDLLSKIKLIQAKKYKYKTKAELVDLHKNKKAHFVVDTLDIEKIKKYRKEAKETELTDEEFDIRYGIQEKVSKNGKMYGLAVNAPNLPAETNYGFIAQDIKEIFPDLVKMDSSTMLYGINYEGFIPILLESVKLQQSEIEENKDEITALKDLVENQQNAIEKLEMEMEKLKKDKSTTKSLVAEPTGAASLEQNIPNPFNQDTEINYYLPESTAHAELNVYDMQGKPVRSYPISQFGQSSMTISGGDLTPGMYLYTLIADDKLIGTKQMVLTD